MRFFRAVIMLAVALLVAPAGAQELGRDYTRLTIPQATSSEKVEVFEFFSWGCSHCAQMYPLLDAWEKQLPPNALLVKVPISLGHREWGQLVRMYYALEAMGELERLEGAVFKAIHEQKQPLFNENRITAWVAAQGVDEHEFRTEFNSTRVTTKAARAEQLARDYRVNQTPQLAVDGKYLVRGQSHEAALEIAGKLVAAAGT